MGRIPPIVTCPVCGRPMPRGERIRLTAFREYDQFKDLTNTHKPWWKWRRIRSLLMCRRCYEAVNETLWRLKESDARWTSSRGVTGWCSLRATRARRSVAWRA